MVGIEIKASPTVGARDFAGLKSLAARTGERFVRGIVLHLGTERLAFGPNLYACPLATLWATPEVSA